MLTVLRDGTQGDKLLDFESFEKAIVSGGYAAIKGDVSISNNFLFDFLNM